MKYSFTDWERIVCCFFYFFPFFLIFETMHPSNCDHKDMQKRGVPNISSEGWGRDGTGRGGGGPLGLGWDGGDGVGAHKIKEKRRRGIPGTVSLHLRCLRWHLWTYKIRPTGEGFNEMYATQVWIKTFNYNNTSVHSTYSSDSGGLITGFIQTDKNETFSRGEPDSHETSSAAFGHQLTLKRSDFSLSYILNVCLQGLKTKGGGGEALGVIYPVQF